MIVEYGKPMNLCEYKTNKELLLSWDKYSYRCEEPSRYFETYEKYKANDYIEDLPPENNYNHIDDDKVPIIDLFQSDENSKLWSNVFHGDEIFLINKEDVELVNNHGEKSVEEAINYLLNKLELIKELYKL
jgi:hypothetical protein|tara:strand:- start:440 stop:832 length:393 start_codon:yes stop_codon:yes gene_type:complete